MTAKQKAYRKNLLTKIHLSERYVGFYRHNKDEWKELLIKHFGVDSSADLDIENLLNLLDFCNFKKGCLPTYKDECATSAQVKYMRDLWKNYARDKSDEAFLNFLQKRFKISVIKLDLIPLKDAGRIIAVLEGFKP